MRLAHRISQMALFAALITAGAWISLPIPPVPVVLSNLMAALAGVVLGPVWGTASVLLYLALGSLGLPVFAGGTGGYLRFAGPTGGFLLGFLLAAAVAGLVADRRSWSPVRNFLAVVAGFVALYAVGLPWLDAMVDSLEGLPAAALAMAPYMIGDLAKAVVGALVVRALKPYLSRWEVATRPNEGVSGR